MGENQTDLERITQTVQHYFQGMYHGDVERLKKAFHPTAFLFGHYQGQYLHISVEDWYGMIKSGPKPSESGEEYDMRIVSTDVTGDVAAVKVADLYMGLKFTDYLTLVKIEGAWVIVNKAFRHE